MTLMTKDGIEIFTLPSVAWCKCAKADVEDMDECPIKNFDDTGDICVPELCEFYTEHISQAESEDEDADKKCTYKETGCGSCKRQLDCPIEADTAERTDT